MSDKDKVLEAFKNSEKPLRLGDIAKQIGIESKEVSKYIKDLKEEDNIYSPKHCFYAMK